MTRPRIAGVLSGIAASVAAFLVVRQWGLLGTVAGAAIIPLVYTLVSHYASEGLDRLVGWLRKRMDREHPAASEQEPGARAAEQVSRSTDADGTELPTALAGAAQRGRRFGSKREWSLAAFALLALGISVYALAASGTVERVIVRERVIEKTVTISAPVVTSVAFAQEAAPGSPYSDTVAQSQGAPPKTTSSEVSTQGGQAPAQPTSTTTTAATTTTSGSGQPEPGLPPQPDVSAPTPTTVTTTGPPASLP